MKYLVIENKGECEPGAFMLMGASTKRNQSGQIGQFGTGFNYSIAVLTREGIQPLVVSGNKRYSFSTDKVSIRDHAFDRITVREGRKKPEPTQFTTAMGLGWVLNASLKELISNAYDEPEPRVSVSGEVMDLPGYTRVYVPMTDDVFRFYGQFDRYFTFRRVPLLAGDDWKIFKRYGPGTRVYRRGVQVYENTELSSCFDYQCDNVGVREDRTADRYNCEYACARIMEKLNTEQHCALMDFLCSSQAESFEGGNNYMDRCCDSIGKSVGEWMTGKVMVTADELASFSDELVNHKPVVLPNRWVETLKQQPGIQTLRDVVSAPRLRGHTVVNVPETELSRLTAALKYCRTVGVGIADNTVSVFETLAPGAPMGYALAETGAMLINREMLGHSVRDIVKVLFEQYVHNFNHNGSFTHDAEHTLIEQWVTSLEIFAKIPKGDELLLSGATRYASSSEGVLVNLLEDRTA